MRAHIEDRVNSKGIEELGYNEIQRRWSIYIKNSLVACSFVVK